MIMMRYIRVGGSLDKERREEYEEALAILMLATNLLRV